MQQQPNFLGRKTALYHLDTSRPEAPRVRTIPEEIARIVRGRLTNPRWIEGMLAHGARGASEVPKASMRCLPLQPPRTPCRAISSTPCTIPSSLTRIGRKLEHANPQPPTPLPAASNRRSKNVSGRRAATRLPMSFAVSRAAASCADGLHNDGPSPARSPRGLPRCARTYGERRRPHRAGASTCRRVGGRSAGEDRRCSFKLRQWRDRPHPPGQSPGARPLARDARPHARRACGARSPR